MTTLCLFLKLLLWLFFSLTRSTLLFSFLFLSPARSRTSFSNRKCSKIKHYLTPTPHNIFEYLPPVFEPGCEDDSEHTKIHEEYKNLVDFMLGSYMEDIGITPDQFESACGKAAIKTTFHQVSFVSMSVGGGRCKIQDVYFLFWIGDCSYIRESRGSFVSTVEYCWLLLFIWSYIA